MRLMWVFGAILFSFQQAFAGTGKTDVFQRFSLTSHHWKLYTSLFASAKAEIIFKLMSSSGFVADKLHVMYGIRYDSFI